MKNFLIIISFISTVLLCGCVDYPNIAYNNSNFNFDNANRVFNLEGGYSLSESNPYNKIETEDGYDIIFHFVKESSD